MTAAIAVGIAGCETGGKGKGSPGTGPERPPSAGPAEPTPNDGSYCFLGLDGKVYFHNGRTGKTYRWNSDAEQWEEVPPDEVPGMFPGQKPIPLPPGVIVESTIVMVATPEAGGTSVTAGAMLSTDAIEKVAAIQQGAVDPDPVNLRVQWGLELTGDQLYHPLVWFKNLTSVNPPSFSADDTVDFYMMTDTHWILATDTDAGLRAAIGAENIFDWRVEVGGGQPPVGELKLQGVSMRNLARFLAGTHIPVVESETPCGTWRLEVDSGATVATLRWGSEVWQTILLD